MDKLTEKQLEEVAAGLNKSDRELFSAATDLVRKIDGMTKTEAEQAVYDYYTPKIRAAFLDMLADRTPDTIAAYRAISSEFEGMLNDVRKDNQ